MDTNLFIKTIAFFVVAEPYQTVIQRKVGAVQRISAKSFTLFPLVIGISALPAASVQSPRDYQDIQFPGRPVGGYGLRWEVSFNEQIFIYLK